MSEKAPPASHRPIKARKTKEREGFFEDSWVESGLIIRQFSKLSGLSTAIRVSRANRTVQTVPQQAFVGKPYLFVPQTLAFKYAAMMLASKP
jgi:hypothetical protein